MKNVLQIKNLQVKIHDKLLVKSISFSIGQGEVLALVGESGSGKSITALSILRLLDNVSQHHAGGEILFNGQNLLALGEEDMCKIRGRKIAMIFQEPMTALNPLHTIGQQIQEVILIHHPAIDPIARTQELLQLVGLDEFSNKTALFPHNLSGGQRQRVMIAMALAGEPDLLVADEPTTALDVTVQLQILELILSLQKKLNMSVLFITHNLNIVRKIVDHICVMKEGEIVESDTKEKVLQFPSHPYTKTLLASHAIKRVSGVNPQAEKLLEVRNLSAYYATVSGLWRTKSGSVRAIDDVSFVVHAGETLGVIGESGCGKTTLAMALLRLHPYTGEIIFQGNNLSILREKQLKPFRKQIQMVFQDPFSSLNPRMTVFDIIAEGALYHKIYTPEVLKQHMELIVDKVGLCRDTLTRYPHEFSGGQRQRIAIARALIMQPRILILDEPTSALDKSVECEVIDLLQNLQTEYQIAYIFISHDLNLVKHLSDQIIVIKQGKIVEAGNTVDVCANPQHVYTQQLLKNSVC